MGVSMIKLALKCAVILGLVLFALQAGAAPITINNSSFESPYLSENQDSSNISRWSVFDTDAGLASHITNPLWYPIIQFEVCGRNMLIASGKENVYLSVAATLSADTLYTLTVNASNVCSRLGGIEYYRAGLIFQLWACDTMMSNGEYTLRPNPSYFHS